MGYLVVRVKIVQHVDVLVCFLAFETLQSICLVKHLEANLFLLGLIKHVDIPLEVLLGLEQVFRCHTKDRHS